MALGFVRLALVLSLVGPAWSTELLPDLAALEPRGTPHQKCHGQSCQIASLSGSSGKPYRAKKAPHDMTLAGDCCLLKYNPSARKRLYRQTEGLKEYCQSHKSFEERSANLTGEHFEDLEERKHCTPKTLIFAKGTSETGPLGNSVGPALQQGLESADPNKWSFHGVHWHNNEFGNTCLGHPGGAHAVKLLEKVARRCPHTKIVMSGYSQGAMVTRNGIAFSKKKSHKHLKGLVTFGDPFNGAPVKKLNKPLVVYCAKGDRVCDGRNIVTQAHLSYVGEYTDKAVQRIIKLTS